MSKIAIFPGTFDPPTVGHLEIVTRGLKIFDKIIIALGINPQKSSLYEKERRLKWIKEIFKNNPNVSIEIYDELTVTFAKKMGADAILRGIRDTTDFEYEKKIDQINRHLFEDIETVYLVSLPENQFISSSLVREIIKWDGDFSKLVPVNVYEDIIGMKKTKINQIM